MWHADLLSLCIDAAGADAYGFKNALGRVALAHESRCTRREGMLTGFRSRTQGNDSQIRPEPTHEYHAVACVVRMSPTWKFAVDRATTSRLAMAGLLSPSTRSTSTSRSRGLRSSPGGDGRLACWTSV